MSSPADPRAPALGTRIGGKYVIERFLAAGGMGAVYEATGPGGERVALKVLLDMSRAARESGALARFLREAELTSQLADAHIVKVFEGGIDPELGCAYLAMQLLAGEDLEGLLERTGPLHPQVAVRVVLQAARGLEAAHRAGAVHRDIKPSNLFLDVRGGEVTVKVCDFGIAKIHPSQDQQHLTSTGHVLGSPMYMSPEQVLSSKRVDARTDVWSLAMTLYHALAGTAPLADCNSFPALVLALTSSDISPLQHQAPWVEPGLCALVHGALLRDLDARCPDMAAFIAALGPHAGGGDELTASMLVAAPPEVRERRASPLPALPASWAAAAELGRGPDPLLGKKLAGRYELARAIGEGGMGAVYEATGPTGAQVAVKVLRADLVGSSPDAMRRFVREARMAMSIQSDHVVRMTEVDTDMALGVPFISMELLEGCDLARLLREAGPLEPSAVCRVFIDACRGLSAAHALGVVHRDIKPANIFLHQPADRAGEVVVKICDFGIAKQTSTAGEFDQTSTDLTRTGGMLGSPLYMSPEQARNAKGVDARTDVWSISMSMYEALCGQRAWPGFSSAGELVLAICTQDVRPLQDIAPWVPPDLADAVHRGLRRDARDRIATVDELARSLAPHAARCPLLTVAALRSLTPAQRSVVAERMSLVGAQSVRDQERTSDVTSDVASDAPGPPGEGARRAGRGAPLHSPPPARAARLATLTILAAGAFGGGLWAVKGGARTSEATAQVVMAPAPERAAPNRVTVSPVGTLVAGRLRVAPPGARATVNGMPREAADGWLSLEGEPGDRFKVVLELDHARQETDVTLGKDGSPSPASVELASAPRQADPATPRSARDKPSKPASTAAGASTTARTTAGTAAATNAAAQPAIGQQKEWR
jgi:serine/threonine protein kinase